MTLFYLSLALVAGIFFGSLVSPPPGVLLAGLLAVVAFLVFFRRRATVLTGLCLILLMGGIWRYQPDVPQYVDERLDTYNGAGLVEVMGEVAGAPELREKFVSLPLAVKEIKVGGESKQVSGTAMVWMPRSAHYRYGDVLSLSGKLEPLSALGNPDYAGYLEHEGMQSLMRFPAVSLLSSNPGMSLMSRILGLRERLSGVLASSLPEPQVALAQGVLLGQRGNIPASVNDDFARSGAAHILTISGLNITIVAGMLLILSTWVFGRRYYVYIWFSLAAIWFYVLLVGMNAPVVRAAIMASLFLAADLFGRQRNSIIAISLAAAVMVAIEPIILWRVSFRLTFLSMVGLMVATPLLQGVGRALVGKVTGGREGIAEGAGNLLVDPAAVTLGSLVLIWPLLSHTFGFVPLMGMPATVLAVPVLAPIIVASSVTGLLGLFSPALAHITGWLVWLLLTYMLAVVRFFASLPLATIDLRLSPWIVTAYYVAVSALYLGGRGLFRSFGALTQPESQGGLGRNVSWATKWLLPSMLALAVLAWSAALASPDRLARVSFLDVGQGEAILVRAQGQDILIDGGPSSTKLMQELGRQLPFWDRKIELVVVTQPHSDHVAGLVGLLERYQVERVLDPGLAYPSVTYGEWLKLVKDNGIATTRARAGLTVDLGKGVKMEVLDPPAGFLKDKNGEVDVNQNSVVLRLTVGRVSLLFPADLGEDGEHRLIMQRAPLAAEVLLVGHHGSRTSTSEEFLAVVNPNVAVVSAGAGNMYGLPSPETMQRLADRTGLRVYQTQYNGAVEVTTDGSRMWVRPSR